MKIIITFILIALSIMASAQDRIYLTANGETRSVTIADNDATAMLKTLLAEGNISVSMHDYGGFEKVGSLPQSLPSSDSQISTAPGDIMLYLGNQMVIFYGQNSWAYTRLGKIDNASASEIKDFLGNGSVDVILSLANSAGIKGVAEDQRESDNVYDLMGRPVKERPLAKGIYIINGKKTVVK